MAKEYIDIFTITSIQDLDEKYGIKGSSRTFGFYTDFKTAEERVRENATDMHECLYLYVVIEKVPEGISQYVRERWFYKYNLEKGVFEPIDEPECVKHYCNFSIG